MRLGSTFKMVVAAAVLEAGVINSKTRIACEGSIEFGDRNFHCWFEQGHQSVNLIQAIERSCDVYFYEIALKTGINRIHDMAKRLGLGQLSGLNLPFEKVGIMPNRDWKKISAVRYGRLVKPLLQALVRVLFLQRLFSLL